MKKDTLHCQGWFGPCDKTNAVRYRMNTAYVDNELNYAILCPECQKACDEHWQEMWREYYSDRL